MKHLLCYGDSMSWGIIPGTRQRHPWDRRWTGILQQMLGSDARVVEECLNGRTTAWNDPFRPGRNGRDMLVFLLQSHAPLDLVVLFLGTNDLQAMYGVGAYESALGVGALVDLIGATVPEPMTAAAPVLLIAPPRIVLPAGTMEQKFRGAEEKSKEFSARYRRVAEERGCHFFDAASCIEPSATDGVHLDELQHRQLAEALYPQVRGLLNL